MTIPWRVLRSLLLALVLGCLLLLALAQPALASVHTYHEQPGQTTYRSRQSLRDQTDMAWQATVFKRYTHGQLQGLYLRLVGFPGRSTVNTQGDLVVQTGTATQWQVPHQLDLQTSALPENAAQYDLNSVLAALRQPIPLTLEVPLAGGKVARLVVAPYVVAEWLAVYGLTDSDSLASAEAKG